MRISIDVVCKGKSPIISIHKDANRFDSVRETYIGDSVYQDVSDMFRFCEGKLKNGVKCKFIRLDKPQNVVDWIVNSRMRPAVEEAEAFANFVLQKIDDPQNVEILKKKCVSLLERLKK